MPEIEAILNRRTDLSTFVVHLTRADGERTPLDQLASIYEAHRIEARSPQGWAKAHDAPDEPTRQSQRVVCFSEVPLEHIHLLTGSITLWGVERRVPLAPYGVALTKLSARRLGVNPVWYVDMTPGRDWTISNALNDLVDVAIQSGDFHSHPAARTFPFIDMMGRWDARETIKEFSWEREWRHVGDVDLADTGAIWLCPEEDVEELQSRVGEVTTWIDPAWGLERIIAHLAGFGPADVSPFANPPRRDVRQLMRDLLH